MIYMLTFLATMLISCEGCQDKVPEGREETANSFLVVMEDDEKKAIAYLNHIRDTLGSVKSADVAFSKLQSLESKFIPSRSRIGTYFNRDIDFNYRHRRIDIELNLISFQIDLLTKEDQIVLSSILVDGYSNLKFNNYDKTAIPDYLIMRNAYYGAARSVDLLFKDITMTGVYGSRCGFDGSSPVEMEQVKWLVARKGIDDLRKMLQCVDCETQAYGVAGFEMLKNDGVIISARDQQLIDHIMKRNSPLRICSGCISGFVEPIY